MDTVAISLHLQSNFEDCSIEGHPSGVEQGAAHTQEVPSHVTHRSQHKVIRRAVLTQAPLSWRKLLRGSGW